MYEKYKNKKIAILGFGVEGKSTFNYLLNKGLKAAIIDKKSKDELRLENPDMDFTDIEIKSGENYLDYVSEFEVIFKSPGIKPTEPLLLEAINSGIVLTSQIEEFLEFCPCPIIGVTGTKGKGTTSTMIFEMLKEQGFDTFLGGNIGVPAIDFLDNLGINSKVVLELSSFQLQVVKKSPHIAVVLNITSEHLDYHKDTFEYRDSKKNIVRFQTKEDFAVVNSDYEVPKEFAKNTQAKVFFVSKERKTNGCFVENDEVTLITANGREKLIDVNDLLLRGRHNLENVTAASMSAFLAGVEPQAIKKVLRGFKGLEHRLELVATIDGVKFYDDSFSTVPETAIAALDSFKEPVILIAGGSSKNSDYSELGEKISQSNIKKLILIGDTAQDILRNISNAKKMTIVSGLTNMEEMVREAVKNAGTGDVVLLSPACASFGLFKNYKDRGNQFKDSVLKLTK